MLQLIFATNNAHKVQEIQAAIGKQIHVISLKEAGIDIDIPEPHDSLEANATEKSRTIQQLTGGNCFSEDTGLEVAALNGEPGVKSARYAGEDKAFDKNIEKLLNKLGIILTVMHNSVPSFPCYGKAKNIFLKVFVQVLSLERKEVKKDLAMIPFLFPREVPVLLLK
nr:non-canonical purine NTP pyrophosphatase [Paraflavitalea speifideiaquila]